MIPKKFNVINSEHNLYQGLCDDGLLVSDINLSDTYLYIIGVDISYDSIDYRKYVVFQLLVITDIMIESKYQEYFKIDYTITLGQKLKKLLDDTKFEYRQEALFKIFGIEPNLNKITKNKVEQIIDKEYIPKLS